MSEVRLGPMVPAADRARWQRTALALAWATMAWNSLEAIIAIVSGAKAGSIALVRCGLNSIVEVGSAIVVVWQFSGADAEREQRALKLIAGSFFVLAAYVAGQAPWDLFAPRRLAILLLGGDTSGERDEWYEWAVHLYDEYLEELRTEGLI